MKNIINTISDQYWYQQLKRANQPPIFIFQMAKVGSSTVYFSLKNQCTNYMVHAHDFTSHHRLSKVRALYQYYSKNKRAKLKIITLVRDPIGRNISAFFQDFERYNGVKFEESALSHEEIKKNFLDNLKHEQPLIWMDRLNEHFKIDVYQTPFIGRDHVKYHNDEAVEVLLFRHDLGNDRKAELIREFLNLDQLVIENYNVSLKRAYGSLYRSFKKELKLPDSYLEMMSSSKYYRHFYSEEDIEAQIAPYR